MRWLCPEIEHRLAEVLDDVRAIEVDIFHQRSAIFAIEDDVFFFSRWSPPLDHHADRVRRPLGGMRNIWRNKERSPSLTIWSTMRSPSRTRTLMLPFS